MLRHYNGFGRISARYFARLPFKNGGNGSDWRSMLRRYNETTDSGGRYVGGDSVRPKWARWASGPRAITAEPANKTTTAKMAMARP